MDNLLQNQYTWGNLFLAGIILVLGYFVLVFLNRMLERAAFLESWQAPAMRMARYALLIYEPLAVIIVGGIFVLINPVFHGLLVGLLFLAGFNHLRNYLAGRVVQFDHHIDRGSRLRSGDFAGVVLELGRLGLQLQTNEGLYHLTYTRLLSEGYTLISGEEIGGFYRLRISPRENTEKVRHQQRLHHLLLTAPYLDWRHKPELTVTDPEQSAIDARVLVREESHLHDLVELIREWGYHCSAHTP